MKFKPIRAVGRIVVAVIVIVIVIIAGAGYFLLANNVGGTSTSSSSSSSSTTSSALSTTTSSVATSSTNTTSIVNIGVLTSFLWNPLFIANGSGIFQRLGIQPKFTVYQSDSAVMTALGSGQADYTLEIPAIISNSVDGGAQLTILANVITEFTPGSAVLVRANSTITSVQQLNGQKVAVSAFGAATDILAKMLMKQYSLNFTEVQLGFTARVPALLSGQVQAIESYDPQVYQLVSSGQARILFNNENFNASWRPYAVAVARSSLVNSNPDLIRKLLLGTFEAIQYMKDNPQESYKILAAVSGPTTPLSIGENYYNDTINYFSTNGVINTTEMIQNIQLQNQLVASTHKIPPLSTMYTDKFVPIVIPAATSSSTSG